MQKGIILKGIGGFYYVSVNNEIIECRARGKFRNKNESPSVGDKVEITVHNPHRFGNETAIDELLSNE